jgi:transcription elongation factor Elf1
MEPRTNPEHGESGLLAHHLTKAVVLVVDKYSQDVHLANLTAGVKYPVKYDQQRGIEYTEGFFSILADLANVQPGVKVFFYRRRIDEPPEGRGFLGEWEAAGYPYEDLQTTLTYNNLKILGCCPHCNCPVSTLEESKPQSKPRCKNCGKDLEGHILPLRFPLKPAHLYSRYLDDNTAYVDITDEGRLSTLIFRKVYGKGRERSVNPILPEEAEKLRRLLARVARENKNQQIPSFASSSPQISGPSHPSLNNYLNFRNSFSLLLRGRGYSPLYDTASGEVIYETILEFWLVSELSRDPSSILEKLSIPPNEQLEWFANQVLFGIGGEKSDVLLLLRNAAGERCRAIVIELKKGAVNLKSLEQIKSYAYWIAQLVTAQVQSSVQRPFRIMPVIIGHRISRGTKPFSSFQFQIPYTQPLDVVVEAPMIFRYSVESASLILSHVV